LKLLRSILSFIKNLIIDIILLEYGGKYGWLHWWIVKYSEWDFDDESGTEKKFVE
jgi:hypothetical protein